MNLTDLNLLAATRRCWKIGPEGLRVKVSCAQKRNIGTGVDKLYEELQDMKLAYVENPAGFQLNRSHNMTLLFGALLPVMTAARLQGYNDFADILNVASAPFHTRQTLHNEAQARAFEAARILLGTTEERLQELGQQIPGNLTMLQSNWVFSKGRAKAAVRYEVTRGYMRAGEAALRAAGGEWVKLWNVSGDHDRDDICDDNEDMGPIPLGATFPSGDLTVPAHPNCVCEVTYQQVRP